MADKHLVRTALTKGQFQGREQVPPTLLSAKLAESLNIPSIGLTFFCWEHPNESEDPDANLPAMMNSLLGQFLRKHNGFDLADILNLGNTQNDDVESLCKVFGKLDAQLPKESTIFCIIDGVSWCQDITRRDEIVEAVRSLLRLAAMDLNCVFKLLANKRTEYPPVLKKQNRWTCVCTLHSVSEMQ